MAEILGAELQADRFISADPGNGVLAALDAFGAAVNLTTWDDATGDVTYSAPAGDGANTRRHLFDRPVVSTSTAQFTTVTAAVVGNVTGNVTGNASTATALQTARTIFGQSFNGTANVTGGITATTGAFSDAVTVAGRADVASTIRSTSVSAPASGTGVELAYEAAGPRGYVLCYDRSAAAYKPFEVLASQIALVYSGSEGCRVSAPGGATETALMLSVNGSAVRRVTVGPADSGGAGFRYLRVAN